jgi:hypothetical protein
VSLRPFRFSAAALASRVWGVARPAPNPVLEWAGIVQQAIHGPAAPRSADRSEILHTMVHLAVYDAVVAIEGGSRPFAARITAAPNADLPAAVATAAWLTARPRLAVAHLVTFDRAYTSCLAKRPAGDGVTEGVRIGRQAAASMLAWRASDGFGSGVAVGRITPFTLQDAALFHPAGSHPLESTICARDFVETRDMGGAASTHRSAEQTDIAWFWAENPYVHWNRNLVALAHSQGLTVARTARLFAMVHAAASDAIIAGFDAQYPDTIAHPSWRPLIVVDHPGHPCDHGGWSTAVIGSVAAFFGTLRVEWMLTTSRAAVPALLRTERSYRTLNELLAEIGNARVWGGRHWRHALRDGALIGARVAAHVQWHHFQPTR